MASILAGVGFTFVYLGLAQISGVARITNARETVLAIDAIATMTRVRSAIVNVIFATESRITRGTFTRVTRD